MNEQLCIAYRLFPGEPTSFPASWPYAIALCVAAGSPTTGYRFTPECSCAAWFRLRDWHGWQTLGIDASSTFGLLGGVDDPVQELVSAAVERNISDLITHSLTLWFDGLAGDATQQVWLLGPPLPKLVGRLASLRLPRSVAIRWITPTPLPDWYSVYPSAYRMQPGFHNAHVATDFDEDSLIRSERVPSHECLIQRLSVFEDLDHINLIDPADFGRASWAGRECVLPSSLRLATLPLAMGSLHQPLWILSGETKDWATSVLQVYTTPSQTAGEAVRLRARGEVPLITMAHLDAIDANVSGQLREKKTT